MAAQDEIRNSAEGQSLALARAVAAAFRGLGWRTREGAAYAGGLVDVAATQAWDRPNRDTRVHVLVRCQRASRVLFSESSRTAEDFIASYALGDTMDLPAFPPPAAPPARVHAAALRTEEEFRAVVDEAFASIDAVLGELRAHDVDVVRDDVDAGGRESDAMALLARRRELVHAVVVTDSVLWTFGERLAKQPWIRLHRARVVGAEERWVDVVSVAAFEKYATAVTRYYAKRGAS
jgi:hypothetical protein